MITPYSDEKLKYDEKTNTYILTLEAIKNEYDIDLSSQVKNGSNGAFSFLKRVSILTYKKIFEHSNENERQKDIIARTEEGREIIYRAMLEQFFYMKNVGDLTLSTKPEQRALWFSEVAYEYLLQPIQENFGLSVCYVGC